MDNNKYYNQNLAYDYDRFLPREKREEQTDYSNDADKIINLPKMSGEAGALRRQRQALRLRAFTVSAVIMVAILLCGNVFSHVALNETRKSITDAQKNLADLKSEETRLEMQIESLLSYKNIEEAARELGMQKKEKRQVTYIETGITSFGEVVSADNGQ